MTTKFGRGMPSNVYWYDTQATNILRERYGKEFSQRGLAAEKGPDHSTIPADELSRMYPAPHISIPKWMGRSDMDCVNRNLERHKKDIRAGNYGKQEVTPKVGDTASHPKSSLRLQKMEDVRYSGFMENFNSEEGLFTITPLLHDKTGVRPNDKPRKPGNRRESKPHFSKTADAAMLTITPPEWKAAEVEPLELACQTTSGSHFADPAPYLKIAGQETVKRNHFKVKTERSDYHEARLFQAKLATEK